LRLPSLRCVIKFFNVSNPFLLIFFFADFPNILLPHVSRNCAHWRCSRSHSSPRRVELHWTTITLQRHSHGSREWHRCQRKSTCDFRALIIIFYELIFNFVIVGSRIKKCDSTEKVSRCMSKSRLNCIIGRCIYFWAHSWFVIMNCICFIPRLSAIQI
jgi:hypothetical protein